MKYISKYFANVLLYKQQKNLVAVKPQRQFLIFCCEPVRNAAVGNLTHQWRHRSASHLQIFSSFFCSAPSCFTSILLLYEGLLLAAGPAGIPS